ncbi:MAG: hypothetical protein M9939_00605 [Mesorhizobium sp.]|nr:hypothetical protein [Mesorhizobium sp.]MCO5159607.1 hypothetical protein [Mesorhizobium sp.]
MDRAKFYAGLRARGSGVFGTSLSQSQVTGIEELLDVAQSRGVSLLHLAYILSGVYHETGGMMVPVREGFAKTDIGARKVVAKRAYGKTAGPYNHVYYGRGRIQNTWLRNMETLSKRFGHDFVKNPDLLLDPAIDAVVTIVGHQEGLWTGKKLSDYISEGRKDYVNARRIVNGTDKAKQIAGYAVAFENALRAAGYIGQAPKPKPSGTHGTPPVSTSQPDPKPNSGNAKPNSVTPPKRGFWAILASILAKFFRRR